MFSQCPVNAQEQRVMASIRLSGEKGLMIQPVAPASRALLLWVLEVSEVAQSVTDHINLGDSFRPILDELTVDYTAHHAIN
jgi:hypothetical protein